MASKFPNSELISSLELVFQWLYSVIVIKITIVVLKVLFLCVYIDKGNSLAIVI